MNSQNPGPDEARADLEQITESRRAAAEATRRPRWVDAGLSTIVGMTIGLGTAGHLAAGWVVLGAGAVAFTVVQQRRSRGRGRVSDQRALGARALRFALLYAVLFVLGQIRPPDTWQPWYSLGSAMLAAAGVFALLRWEERYQVRRLTAGDYGRYDLL